MLSTKISTLEGRLWLSKQCPYTIFCVNTVLARVLGLSFSKTVNNRLSVHSKCAAKCIREPNAAKRAVHFFEFYLVWYPASSPTSPSLLSLILL